MKISIAGAAVAGLVGAVVAIAVAASGLAKFGPPQASVQWLADATIYIDSNGQGGCVITTVPQTLPASKHGKVEWSIVDHCGVTAKSDVEVKFKSLDPLDKSCVKKHKKRIKCDVDSKSDYGTYPYTVIAGDYSEDPDLEIAQ